MIEFNYKVFNKDSGTTDHIRYISNSCGCSQGRCNPAILEIYEAGMSPPYIMEIDSPEFRYLILSLLDGDITPEAIR